MKKIGIIGGSGLDDPDILTAVKDISIKTPYGDTSSTLRQGIIEGEQIIFIARHGRNHSITPSNVNYRANIWALKELGCEIVIASTAVGSLRQEIKPGHIVLPNQLIDFTKQRESTFFFENEVVHTPMADPFSNELIDLLIDVIRGLGIIFHTNKTVITIEGPRFSSKSESNMFRSWGADIINMSTCPEAILARELDLKYVSIAMSTDYDSWKDDEEPVSWELVKKIMDQNSSKVIDIFRNVIPLLNSSEI